MRRVFSFAGLVILLGMVSAFPGHSRLGASNSLSESYPSQQGYTSGKTNEDYTTTVLSRNTKPLGLKENVILRNLLRQPSIKWAIRAGLRNILD